MQKQYPCNLQVWYYADATLTGALRCREYMKLGLGCWARTHCLLYAQVSDESGDKALEIHSQGSRAIIHPLP